MATITKSLTVSSEGVYTVTLNATPDGTTVTPVNDVQLWLQCADIFDKEYTTVSQVLTDATTLSALISSENAVKYMVRSTDFATDICADETAMSYIGLNNYCSNTLLNNTTWRNAICNSTYFESVLNIKVPTMTSDNTPSGSAWVNATSHNPAYYAFDNNSGTRYDCVVCKPGVSTGIDLYYMFPYEFKLVKFTFVPTYGGFVSASVAASIDGSAYNTVKTYSGWPSSPDIIEPTNAKYLRLSVVARNDNSWNDYYPAITSASYWGRKDV